MITGGVLSPGSKLPGVRQLADYLGINRHTVSRALHALEADGLIKTIHSRGTFVVDRISQPDERDSVRLHEIVDHAVLASSALGYSVEELASTVLTRGFDVAEGDNVRIAFVECNTTSLQQYASDLHKQLGVDVEPLLISDLQRRKKGKPAPTDSCDLIVTTLGHMPEVRRLVGDDLEVFPIALGPYLQVLLSVMALPPQCQVGIVTASEAGSVGMKRALVQAGLTAERLRLASMEQPQAISTMVGQVDALVVSFAVLERVKPLLPDPPPQLIEYRNVLDQTGIEALKERLQDVRAAKAGTEAHGKTVNLMRLRRALAEETGTRRDS